jgi:hypothetical protein
METAAAAAIKLVEPLEPRAAEAARHFRGPARSWS